MNAFETIIICEPEPPKDRLGIFPFKKFIIPALPMEFLPAVHTKKKKFPEEEKNKHQDRKLSKAVSNILPKEKMKKSTFYRRKK